MAKRDKDPRVTDLSRYKREREKAARKPAPNAKPKPTLGGGLLGRNPRAGLILAIIALVVLALWGLPLLMR